MYFHDVSYDSWENFQIVWKKAAYAVNGNDKLLFLSLSLSLFFFCFLFFVIHFHSIKLSYMTYISIGFDLLICILLFFFAQSWIYILVIKNFSVWHEYGRVLNMKIRVCVCMCLYAMIGSIGCQQNRKYKHWICQTFIDFFFFVYMMIFRFFNFSFLSWLFIIKINLFSFSLL